MAADKSGGRHSNHSNDSNSVAATSIAASALPSGNTLPPHDGRLRRPPIRGGDLSPH